MCQTENKTNCTRANAKDLRGAASSTCEEVHKPGGSERLTLQSQARALKEKGEAHSSSSNFSDPVIITVDERGNETSVT